MVQNVLLIVFAILAASALFAAGVKLANHYQSFADEKARRAVDSYRETLHMYGVLREPLRLNPPEGNSHTNDVHLYMQSSPRVAGGAA